MNNVTFTIQSGGLGRPLAGQDHVTGLVTYIADADIPAGFTTTDRVKIVYSLQDAVDLGITSGSSIDEIKVLNYNIAELFRVNKKAIVYVGIDDNAAIDYSFIETVQLFAEGKIRQFGVITHSEAYASGTITSLNTSALNMATENRPAVVVLGCDVSGTALASLPDLRALSKKYVSAVCGQDGNATGAALSVATGTGIPNVGAVLGAITLAKVNENVGWPSKFNLVSTTELDVPAFADGSLVKNQTASLIDAINTKGWIFFIKHDGLAGSYINDSHTAISVSDDFAYIENNRTIQKAIRGVRTFLLPDLNAPLYINADGTLTEETIAHFKNNATRHLEQMQRDGEISAFEVSIDPTQDVLTSSELAIGISVVPVGVARTISVNIGFVVSIQS